MKIWKNTTIFDSHVQDYNFIDSKSEAELVLLGSKKINLSDFKSIKGIFRAGIGRDNVPEQEASVKNINVCFPSDRTINIIFDETASFTCGLILRMIYEDIGSVNPWERKMRSQLLTKKLLILGVGNIGSRLAIRMKNFMNVLTFDYLQNDEKELKNLISEADCITLHIPNNKNNYSFIDQEKLSWMKTGAILINTSRGNIVNEKALFHELKSRRLKAAFDVFWEEPYNGILKEFHPNNFYMTPHAASTCAEFISSCKSDLDRFIKELK